MSNVSRDRFNQVQDGENNDTAEKSRIPVSQERQSVTLEGAKEEEKDAAEISINDLFHYVKQTVLLLRQSSNAITYYRRLNVVKSMLKREY